MPEAADIKFYWTHGMEMELQLVDKNNRVVSGENAMRDIEPMIKNARSKLVALLASDKTPALIKEKIQAEPELEENQEKGLVVTLNYQIPQREEPVKIEVIGRDGNVTISTYILELVTPPCETVKELEWWLGSLQKIIEESLNRGYKILSTGLNPLVNRYTRGLSFADQHHLGIQDGVERMAAYNMLRNFVPHLIGLSTNSPFIDGKPTDSIRIARNRVLAPGCVKSLRLEMNESMLSGGLASQYIPYMETFDPEFFTRATLKASLEDAKFQDLFPFSQFDTIETRIMDAQLTNARRIGFAIVVQALARKGTSYLTKNKPVPDAGVEDLYHNRNSAIERGLLAPHRKSAQAIWDNEKIDPEFVRYYYGTLDKQLRYLFESVQNMFLYLEHELKEMGAWETPYIRSLMSSVFWGIDEELQAPVTGAEYQLYLYQTKNQDIGLVIEKLREIYLTSMDNPTFDPILSRQTLDATVYEKLLSDPAVPAKPSSRKKNGEKDAGRSFIGVIKKEDLAAEQARKRRRKILITLGVITGTLAVIGAVTVIILLALGII